MGLGVGSTAGIGGIVGVAVRVGGDAVVASVGELGKVWSGEAVVVSTGCFGSEGELLVVVGDVARSGIPPRFSAFV